MEPQLYVELMMLCKLMNNDHKSCFTGNVYKEDVILCYKHEINVDVSRMRLIYALHFSECYTCLCKLLKLFIRKLYPHVNNTLS